MKKYLALFFLLLVQGCASYSGKKEAFHKHFNVGDFETASKIMYATKNDPKDTKAEAKTSEADCEQLPADYADLGRMKFFIGLNSGTAALYSQNYVLSDTMFGIASDAIDQKETDGYSPKYYEKVMLNTYRAVALLQGGDINNAKVEFNRADSSQRQAAQENKKEINELREEAEAKYAQNLGAAGSVLAQQYTEFNDFEPYADFVNPYTSYMKGLFLALYGSKSDRENAILDLKRVKGMSPKNKYVKADIQMAQNLANGKALPPTVWVIYENGLISEVEKQHFAIPFIINDRIKLAHMALPKLVPQAEAYPNLVVVSNKQKIATESVVDMDRVMKTEFKNRYPAEVMKAVVWMTVNLLAQEAAQQAFGNDNQLMGNIAALAIGAASNPVETRTWSSLPKNIQIARFSMPKNRKIQIFNNSGQPLSEEIKLDKKIKQALVIVRVPSVGAKPAISVTKLK